MYLVGNVVQRNIFHEKIKKTKERKANFIRNDIY